MDGSCQPVTSQPLSAPQAMPVMPAASNISGRPAPARIAMPIASELRPIVAAIDRSISPAVTSSAIASAMMPFSDMLVVLSAIANGATKPWIVNPNPT